jgi:HK97 family phage major capsid protein
MEEIEKLLKAQSTAFEDFKKKNDERLAEIEKKGSADPLTTAALDKINEALDGYKDKINALETKNSRPNYEIKSDEKGNKVSSPEYTKAIDGYLRKGTDFDVTEIKGLSVGSNPDGGYLVTPEKGGIIATRLFDTSPMRQYATVQVISSDSYDIIADNDEAAAGWVGETEARSETATPSVDKLSIPVHEIYAEPRATQKLLDDSEVDVEGWLAAKVADKFARIENDAFINGNGSGKPKGILSYSTTTSAAYSASALQYISSGSNGSVGTNADKMLDLMYALKAGYRQQAALFCPRALIKQLRQLKLTDKYLWSESLAAGQPATFNGYPIVEAEDLPAAATGSFSLMFGDMKRAYTIVDRIGVRVIRDVFTAKPFVKFYTTKRVGGGIVNFEALKLMQLS